MVTWQRDTYRLHVTSAVIILHFFHGVPAFIMHKFVVTYFLGSFGYTFDGVVQFRAHVYVSIDY